MSRVLEDAGEDTDRWVEVVEKLESLDETWRKKAIDGLRGLAESDLERPEKSRLWSALRQVLSHHRSYPEADWSMPETDLGALETVYKELEPPDPAERLAWYFAARPALPEGRDQDWEAFEKSIEKLQEEAIDEILPSLGVGGVCRLAERAEQPVQVGRALGRNEEVSDKEIGDLLASHLGKHSSALGEMAFGVVIGRSQSKGRAWVEEVQAEDWSSGQRAQLLRSLPFDEQTWSLLRQSDSESRKAFWKPASPFGVRVSDVDGVVRGFLESGRPTPAVSFLVSRRQKKEELEPSLVLDVLEAAAHTTPEEGEDLSLFSHGVTTLVNHLQGMGEVDLSRLAAVEWAFLPLERGSRGWTPRTLHKEFARNPEFFVEVVCVVYRAETEEAKKSPSEAETDRALNAHTLLESWRAVPGVDTEGAVDVDELSVWVRGARERLAKAGRAAIGDQVIGQMLSGAPSGADGGWPHEAVRSVIEETESRDLETGMEIGRYNSRGVVARDRTEGGKQEYDLARKFGSWAEKAEQSWPRTAAMLRRLESTYRRQGRKEDEDDRLRELS